MIAAIRSLLDRWRGSGAHAAIVPPMDGVLGPNQAIEEAPVLLGPVAPDNLILDGGDILFSTGRSVMQFGARDTLVSARLLAAFESEVAALAVRDGMLAVGLEAGGVRVRGGRHDGKVFSELGGRRILCPTALLITDADTLLVALGSQQNAPSLWRHDLMQKNASGSVWRVNLTSGQATCLADDLAWPCGLLDGGDGKLIVSESWRSRLLAMRAGRPPAVVLADIAGYPGRLAAASDGGAWLAVFAPRSQLVEFVLREDDYRRSMMAEVEPRFWVAPSLSSAQSFLEPMQLGGLKQLGMLKPWAPTRSYGLIVGLDTAHEPRVSFHSRADGRRHGITSALETGGRLLATSKGGDAIVSLPLDGTGVCS
jgi:hypothetical protein